MERRLRKRFWVEIALSVATCAILVLTLIWHDWIELLLGADPDGGGGSLEWLITLSLLAITASSGSLARFEWRKARATTA